MKKTAGIFLLISSLYWITIVLKKYYIYIQENVLTHLSIFEKIIEYTYIIIPISLFLLSIDLLRNKAEVITNVDSISQNEHETITVGNWLVYFLISIIPVIGLVFMLIWASDDENKLRKNWAIASLIWMGILIIFSLIFYSVIYSMIIENINSAAELQIPSDVRNIDRN
jgi:hypothetical protein